MVQTKSFLSAYPAQPAGLPSLTASAATLPIGSPMDVSVDGPMFGAYQGNREWQAEVYRHLQICSEARQAVILIARGLGRLKVKASTPAAQAALDAIFSGPLTLRDYFERGGAHVTAGGEFYFIGRRATAAERVAYPGLAGKPIWEVRQPTEVSNEGHIVWIQAGLASPVKLDTRTDGHIQRVWQPDFTDQNLPDSPLRALLPVLSEIEAGTNRIWAQMTSRLTGNGILSVPESWETPALPGQPPNPANRKNSIMRNIAAVASMAMQDPRSPAARLPLFVTKPDGSTDNIEWHTFWSELDAATVENRKEAIMRFAIGMDIQAEEILGLGGQAQGQSTGSNRWNVWQIKESTIAEHIEPIGEVLLVPLIRLVRTITGDDEAMLELDSTSLRIKPDRSKEALELYDRGLIDEAAARRENGFEETDAPSPEEAKAYIVRKMILGSGATPEMLAIAAREIGLDVPDPEPTTETPRALPQNQLTQVDDEKAVAMLNSHGENPRNLTASARAINTEFVVSCEATVLRLLERVGSKLIRENSTKTHPVQGVDPTQAHLVLTAAGVDWTSMLAGPNAFGMALLASAAQPGETLDHLTEFAESLVHARKPYTREALIRVLEEAQIHG